MANPDILITPGQGTIGFSGTNTGTIQLRVAESGDIHFEGDQGSLLSLSDDLSDSLFSVNDAAGMPVFEVFADDTIKAYRNNEAKLEIDPDNNRIRLRDNTYVSGSLFITGQEAIYLRTSASSTRIRSDNQINFLTEGGSAQMARFKKIQVSTNYSATADFNDNGIVFGTDANLFRSAANTLKTDGNLVVIGDMTVSGDITSASATHEATSYTASTHVSGISGYFGKMGIGYSDNFHPDARLIVGQNPNNGFAIIAGSDNVGVAPQISNSQTKVVRIGMPHYTITEEPVTLMTATSSSSKTDIHIGGGTSYGNSTENMYLRTAASHTTTKGTTALYINNDQEVVVGSLGGLTTAAGLGAALTVSGDASISGELKVDSAGVFRGEGLRDGSWHRGLEITTENSNFASLYFGGQSTTKYSALVWTSSVDGNVSNKRGAQIFGHPTSASNTDLRFFTNDAVGSSDPTSKMIIRGNGRVGIGTTGPLALVDIASDDGTDHTDDTPDTLLRLRKTFLSSADKDSAVNFDVSRYIAGGNNRPRTRLDFVLAGDENDTYDNREPNVNVLSIRSDRKVGIGTTNPASSLEVSGSGQMTNLAIKCTSSYRAANIAEVNNANLAFRISQTRQGQTSALAMGSIGSNNADVGIQAYDSSDDSNEPLGINPFGGSVGIGTASPSYNLDIHDSVHAQLAIDGDTTSQLLFGGSTNNRLIYRDNRSFGRQQRCLKISYLQS
jgi:hypothetical protein